MSLARFNYRKHKNEKFPVWPEDGGERLCLAIQQSDGSMMLGFIGKALYSCIEWVPHEERLKTIAGNPLFWQINRVEEVKRGFFIFSTLRFTLATGESFVGKTDKSFADFILKGS